MWMNDEPPHPSEFHGHHEARLPWTPLRFIGSGWLDASDNDVWIKRLLPNFLAEVEYRDGVTTVLDWRDLWCDCMTG